ncbi:MAG: N-acetylmuramoyl-L-alanine amidase [Thermodesulfovibrionales bacterium]
MLKRGILALIWIIVSCVVLQFKADAQSESTKSQRPTVGSVEVNVRFSENPEGKRIVFESADETFIKKTSATVLKDSIQVRFPAAPILRYRNDINLSLSIQGNVVNIRLKEPFRIKTLYLNAPPRFSIDVFKMEASAPVSPLLPTPSRGDETAALKPAVTRIIIDPGHGGYDAGIIHNDMREKDLTLSIAREMESMLLKKNRPVFLTRRIDQFISITDRAIAANQKTPGIFISLHLSLSDGFVINIPYIDRAEQTEELFNMMYRQRRYIDKSKALAEALGRAIKEDLKIEVIYREVPITLLDSIGAPAVMVELPGSLVFDKGKRMRLSQTLLKGIDYAIQ